MPDFAAAIYARLAADPAVSGDVGTKIYWLKVPQGTGLPYIRLQTISDPRPAHLKGLNGARVTRVQADCFGSSYGMARQLSEKIIVAMTFPATAGGIHFGFTKAEGPRDLGEDVDGKSFVHRASIDLLVEHRPV